MNKYYVTISKGTVTYEVEAENEEKALDTADEWYNERDFEDVTIVKMNKE